MQSRPASPLSDTVSERSIAQPALIRPGPILGMIADDLTGACDTGAQFALHGFRTVVRLGSSRTESEPADLLAVTTGSRADTPDDAREKVQRACRFLRRRGATVFYKKIDSTLRGNVGPEIEAILDTCGHPFAIVTPAFPDMGRTMVGGSLCLDGRIVSARTHLPTLLRSQGLGGVVHVGREVVCAGPAALEEALGRLHAAGGRCICVDAASAEDLATIAHAALSFVRTPLLVGSAGLAAQAAEVLAERGKFGSLPGRDAEEGQGITADCSGDTGAVVLFIGSPHPVTAAQVARLVEGGHAEVVPLDARAVERACAVRAECPPIFSVQWPRCGRTRFLHKIVPLVEARRPCGMVLSGGDTAALVCRALGARGLRLEGEVRTGVPWGRLIGGRAHGMAVCTKSGGFGSEEALVEAVDFLTFLDPV